MGYPERGIHANRLRHHIVADVTNFGQAFRLWIGEQDSVEPRLLVLPAQREVDGGRQRTGGVKRREPPASPSPPA